jgi:hypothetical protein
MPLNWWSAMEPHPVGSPVSATLHFGPVWKRWRHDMTGTHLLAANHVPPFITPPAEKDTVQGNASFANAFTENDDGALSENICGGTGPARPNRDVAELQFRHVVRHVSEKINCKAATAIAAEVQTETTTDGQ